MNPQAMREQIEFWASFTGLVLIVTGIDIFRTGVNR
jgi:hypothetical protein